jgi:hypothetical protein
VVSPAYSGQIAGHHPPRGLAANSRREQEHPPRERNASAPRYRTAKSGQLAGNQRPPRGLAVFLGSIRPAIGQRIRGARGERYPPRYRRCKSAPVSVSDAPLSAVKSRQIAESTIRPLPALLAHRYRISGHNSARVRAVYIRTRQPVSARELHPRAGLHCVWEPGQRWHRSRGNYVRSGQVWPASAPYRSRSRG